LNVLSTENAANSASVCRAESCITAELSPVDGSLLDRWLDAVLADYSENVLPFDADAAQVWGRLRVPHPENPLDKQIAATALPYEVDSGDAQPSAFCLHGR
jgi:hypothetical protein